LGIFFDRIAINLKVNNNSTVVFMRLPGYFILVDTTNSCAYATVLCPSVVVAAAVVCNVCIVAKRCALEQKLRLTTY